MAKEKSCYTLRITLRSDMCAGSGESSGITVDSDICVDSFGLPYIPARRIKGVLRAAAEQLNRIDDKTYSQKLIEAVFGTSSTPGALRMESAELPDAARMQGYLRSLRANAADPLHTSAQPLNVTRLFTSVRGQTKLDNGVASEGTLRYTRVLNHYSPLEPGTETYLEAPLEIDADQFEFLNDCCRAARHIGSKRNRGLGLVVMTLTPCNCRGSQGGGLDIPAGDLLDIAYTVSLDAPVTLPGCGELLQEIPARSVIGCLVSALGGDDPDFRALFLTGEVKWSALTPQVNGHRTTPAPLMLTYLKNESRYVNRFAPGEIEIEGKKRKTVEGAYAAQTDNGFALAKVRSHMVYHHHLGENGTLYTQESLDTGMLYAGTVRVPRKYAQKVIELLRTTPLAFGRSRTAQYAACRLVGEPKICPASEESFMPQPDSVIYLVLQSDLIPALNGIYTPNAKPARRIVADKLGVSPDPVDHAQDFCQFHTVGGYHAMWHLQKQQLTAVRGGSVFCFRAGTGEIPKEIRVGELQQEGFGVCRIYSEEEMSRLSKIQKFDVDSAFGENEMYPALESALRAAEIRRIMADAVREYEPEALKKGIKTGMIGRLREILNTVGSYEELLEEIQKIKTSDTHSENTKSRRDNAMELVTELYNKVKEDMRDAGLLTDKQTEIPGDWKLPLQQLLHHMYYSPSRKEAGEGR